jgi:hypothetical protein
MKLGAVVTAGPTTAHARSLISAISRAKTRFHALKILTSDIKVVIVVSLPVITRSTALTNIPILIGVGLDLARGVLPVVA